MLRTAASIAFVLALAPAAPAGEPAGPDTVRVRGGPLLRGTIASIDRDELTLTDEAGAEKRVRRLDVESWTLGAPPPALREAERALDSGDAKTALAGFRSAREEVEAGKARPIHRQFAVLGEARARRADGDLDGAIESFRSLLTSGEPCAVRAEAVREALAAARQKDDAAFLLRTVEGLVKVPGPEGLRAEVELARIAWEAGDPTRARSILTGVLGKGLAGPVLADALLLRIRCLEKLKLAKELDAACRKALEPGAPLSPSLVQAAGAALARAGLESAGEDADRIRAALAGAARAISWGPPSRDASADDLGSALWTAARCSKLLAAKAGKAEAQAEYRARAAGYLREAARACPGTEWARKASAELAAGSADEKAR